MPKTTLCAGDNQHNMATACPYRGEDSRSCYRNLPPAAFHLLDIIRGFIRRSGIARPGLAALAAMLKVSITTVKRLKAALVAAKLLWYERRYRRSNQYFVDPPEGAQMSFEFMAERASERTSSESGHGDDLGHQFPVQRGDSGGYSRGARRGPFWSHNGPTVVKPYLDKRKPSVSSTVQGRDDAACERPRLHRKSEPVSREAHNLKSRCATPGPAPTSEESEIIEIANVHPRHAAWIRQKIEAGAQLAAVKAAVILAVYRKLTGETRHLPIRSMAYFEGTLSEIAESPGYCEHVNRSWPRLKAELRRCA